MNTYDIKQSLSLGLRIAQVELKIQRKRNYLGIIWYILNPLFLFIILLLIFSNSVGKTIPNYPAYVLFGIILFNFFRQSTIEATRIIFDNRQIIKSIHFDHKSLILSILFKTSFAHIFEFLLFLFFIIYYNLLSIQILLYPIIFFLFFLFTFGFSLLLASISVYVPDVENIWIFSSQLLWFITPIFYYPNEGSILYLLNKINPLFYFISAGRDLFIYKKIPQSLDICVLLFFTFLFIFLGILIFNKLKYKFAELV